MRTTVLAASSRPVEKDFSLEVASVREVAEGVVSLELRHAGGEALPDWDPGAHIDVTLGERIVRQYSLCGPLGDRDTWRIAVLREPEGRGGSRLVHDVVKAGDVLPGRGPRNNFHLAESDRYLFIAGGIGITPILPMVREVAVRNRPWTMVYGGRSAASMAFVDELEAIPGGELHVLPQDQHGLLDLDRFLGQPAQDTLVYCCGPAPLLDAVEERCASWPQGALRIERFVAGSQPVSTSGEFEVELASSGRRLAVPVDMSLLDVLEEAGYEITNSCRAGICGTCLTGVVDGVPEHNDDVLTDEERDANKLMLPCVSRSLTRVLKLDL